MVANTPRNSRPPCWAASARIVSPPNALRAVISVLSVVSPSKPSECTLGLGHASPVQGSVAATRDDEGPSGTLGAEFATGLPRTKAPAGNAVAYTHATLNKRA